MKKQTDKRIKPKVRTERGAPVRLHGVVSSQKPKLYEITALVSYSAVIYATSKEDAMEAVSTWENAWHDTADLIGVSDVSVLDVRPLKASDWNDEAHEATPSALAANSSSTERNL